MVKNFLNDIPKEIYGFETTDLAIMYLIIGAVFSLIVVIYNCTEAILYKRKEDIDKLFPDNTVFLGLFFLFFYPLPLFLFIMLEIMSGLDMAHFRIKRKLSKKKEVDNHIKDEYDDEEENKE